MLKVDTLRWEVVPGDGRSYNVNRAPGYPDAKDITFQVARDLDLEDALQICDEHLIVQKIRDILRADHSMDLNAVRNVFTEREEAALTLRRQPL